MKHFNKKILSGFVILLICLVGFICFSKAGILFSSKDNTVITVSTEKKNLDTSKYVASVASVAKVEEEETTTTSETTKEETTTTVKTTASTTVATTTQAEVVTDTCSWDGPVLSKSKGVVQGPSGKETYYNLNMSGVVSAMRYMGFSEQEYPYWVREDGVKMLGNYVIVAASYSIRPKGSIVPTSLGCGIVSDTGGFAQSNPTQIDIAVTW